MNKPVVYKCPACRRRVKRSPYVSLTDRNTRWERRFHGAPHFTCLETAAAEAERRGPDEVILRCAHPRSCSDPGGRMACRGAIFTVEQAA